MSKRDERIMRFAVPADKLLRVLIHPEYQVAREKEMGALEARVEDKSRTDDRLEYEVINKQYVRGVTGVDKSKTETTSTVYTWDLKARRATWTHRTNHGERVKVHGALRVEPDGENSKLVTEFNIEVKIPLVGGMVESMILKEVSAGWAYYERTIQGFCEKLA